MDTESPEKRAEQGAKPRSPAILALRLFFSVALIVALLVYFDIFEILNYMYSIEFSSVALGIAILSAQYLLSWYRWHFVLTMEEPTFGKRRSFSIFGVGSLANLVLVTSLAGLSARGLLLLREGLILARIIAVLAVDRIAALAGMALCILVGVVLSPEFIIERVQVNLSKADNLWILALVISAVLVLVAVLWRLAPVRQGIAEIRSSFHSPGIIIFLVTLSALVVALGFVCVAVLSKGMGIDVDPFFFVSAMPLIAFVASLPISVGGWGVREGTMLVGLSLFNVPSEAAIALSLTYGLAGVIVAGIFGGLASVMYLIVWRTRRA